MIIEERIIDADFRNSTVTALRDEADIIVTNPPFSLFRKFLAWIMEGQKQFLILGSMNAITYKEVFPLIRDNQIWLGVLSGSKEYVQPDGTMKKMGNTCWFTNIDHAWRHKQLNYVPIDILAATGVTFSKYDNYDAIDVPKCVLIPANYDGVMGVPISFLDKYNPEQFEILGITQRNDDPYRLFKYTAEQYTNANDLNARATIKVNGIPQSVYARILIKFK